MIGAEDKMMPLPSQLNIDLQAAEGKDIIQEKYDATCTVLEYNAVLMSDSPTAKYSAVPWRSQLTLATIANQSSPKFAVLKLCSGGARVDPCGV